MLFITSIYKTIKKTCAATLLLCHICWNHSCSTNNIWILWNRALFINNTTLHPKSPLKICGIWPKSVVFEPNSHRFWKSVRIWLKHHRFWSNSTDVVVLIINILLRRVEFGIWLSNTTEKFEISRGEAEWNYHQNRALTYTYSFRYTMQLSFIYFWLRYSIEIRNL